MFKPPIFFECPSSLLTVRLQSSSCGVSIFLLWRFHLPPVMFPFLSLWPSPLSLFRIQMLISQGLCVHQGPNTLAWLFPPHGLCSVVWTCLFLSDCGRRISAQLCALGDTLSSCVPVSRGTLPESLLTACLLGSGPDTELSPAAFCLLLCTLCEAGPSWQQHTVCYAYRDVTDLGMV